MSSVVSLIVVICGGWCSWSESESESRDCLETRRRGQLRSLV